MLVFDIGANVGNWALANYNELDNIVCVEASPYTFNRLVSNIGNRNRITCLNMAVCDSTNETVEFFHSEADTISTLDRKWLDDPTSRFYKYCGFHSIMVPAISLDKLIQLYGTPDLLKIDVEGAENIVIRSLSCKVQTLCFEWASEWNEKTFEGIRHLTNLGYSQFHVQDMDSYTFRPSTYEHTTESLIGRLKLTRDKEDWGMIWCK
jgi:FkbM family methyltransferase